MSPLVEFHVSSLWGLKPDGVRRILSELKSSGFENSEFLFDQRHNWFQITCQVQDAPKITLQLKTCLEELEEDVLDEDEDLVDDDGALVKQLDNNNAWIGLWDEKALMEARDFTQFRFPDAFNGLPHRDIWDALKYRRISDIMNKDQFRELQMLHNVVLGHNWSLTEVYIGAESKDELDRVRAKLDVLLKIKELKDSGPMHLFWTEAYKEMPGFEMTFDTRFLANIDNALITATFLDPMCSADSALDYEKLAEAITLRLCRYDEHRGYHTSLIGPKLKARRGAAGRIGKLRYGVCNRSDARQDLYGAGIGPKDSSWLSPEKGAAAESQESPYKGSEVEKWLNELEGTFAVAKPSVVAESSTISSGITIPPAKVSSATDQQLINIEEPAVPVTPSAAGGMETKSLVAPTRNLLASDDVFVAPTIPAMRPLVPKTGSISPLAVAKQRDTGGPPLDINANTEKSNRPGNSRASSRRNASRDLVSTHASVPSKAVARQDLAATQVPAWFILELNQAIRNLVSTGPYLRGKVSLRADLGRILITGMDYTALAFNPSGTPSNGWKKHHILRILNQGSRAATSHGIAFTNMLTQEGDDIEYMLSILDIATEEQVWKPQRTESVVYSFYCFSKGDSFFMDIEADEQASRFNYSFRTKQDDKAPIWIHCTLRSWDALIIMSHVDTYALEAKYGKFAKSFVDCFVVSLSQDNIPHIQIGVHQGFGVTVESMRIHTSFRFLSSDENSYFDITEVEETVFKACSPPSENAIPNGGPASPDEWMFYTIEPKRLPEDVRVSEEQGIPTFWYEASVRSVAAEKEFAANLTMGLGEEAPWNFSKLAELGVIASICKPTSRMVQTMDSVGAYNDNKQAAKLTLPRMNQEGVPGAKWVAKRNSSASSSVSQARIHKGSPATLVQASGPPGTVAPRESPQGYRSPPATATSPAARTAAASPAQRRIEGPVTPSKDRTAMNSFASAANHGGGGFGVHGPRTVSRNRQLVHRQPSATGSEASRGNAASRKPPQQFW
ncbi:hypothetical protein BR93DRAFT_923233 [Coniochaeta sp. PMI_546]|nr:hypothetical protein BR93DRAFT_923233 [Coniochaeta sp. PMI_546]